MEAAAEGLWGLADYWEKRGETGKAVKCLEAICGRRSVFLPITEVKSCVRVASLLLKHSHNVSEAKIHLERAQLLLKKIPSCLDLKCRTFSLLSQAYHLLGSPSLQKQALHKALHLLSSSSSSSSSSEPLGIRVSLLLWTANFNSQLANFLISEGDFPAAISALESGFSSATELDFPELQMFFATSVLHVHLMQWTDETLVQSALLRCDQLWTPLPQDRKDQCPGLLFYNELLHIFYQLHICDYKKANHHVEILDAAIKASIKADSHRTRDVHRLTNELNALNQSLSRPDLPHRDRSLLSSKHANVQRHLSSLTRSSPSSADQSLEPAFFGNMNRASQDKLLLAPSPIDGEWLPKSAVYALVDLMVVLFGRPKGNFKECAKRIQSGMQIIQAELLKLEITDNATEGDLQHSAIGMAGVYLVLLMQFLENKVAVELTRSEFVDAQEVGGVIFIVELYPNNNYQALVQMRDWFLRFPTILHAYESIIEMLRGQYAHAVGCYKEAAFHYTEAMKLTESKSMQFMCQIYTAVSYFCLGDAESSSQALELVGPIYRMKDSFGDREQATVHFAFGLLLMRQDRFEESRVSLAKGLQIAHRSTGNLQLTAQYLTVLGYLALALHDTRQAKEILRSSLTLGKTLCDIPTQIWVLSVLTSMYKGLGQVGNEMENEDYRKQKLEELQKKLADARASNHHIELIDKARMNAHRFHEIDRKRAMESQSMTANLDIPESVGLSNVLPTTSSRLLDLDSRKRGKKKI
ncbi:hypothetical protein Tsubulata_025325 [Turnera subulata]|uniref:MalT-like TPR region domain-containing protein n=1 Tax=Turnera subulata TaxID=218843 RepID=A0A9Q0J6X9_9ROSI|nr:hypothetical protein Tsubulata_025325 [Turnera subulata]